MMESKDWVLIVDDDEDIGWAVQIILCDHGLRTVAATSARAALEILRGSSPPTVMVVDLRMPAMSGQELVSAVRQDAALAGIRIIGMSGEMNGPDIAREMRLADYLVKPIDVSRLVAAVRQAIATPGGDGVEAGL